MSNPHQKSVLITGCSDGSMGAALAVAFHEAGLRVFATSRDTAKMAQLAQRGIATLPLDVVSSESIAACISQLPVDSLDILVNNAGANYMMPTVDADIKTGKEIFDLNFWAPLAVTQAFMPLLLASRSKDGAMVANHTSGTVTIHFPFQSIYSASKAALATLTDTMRLELQPFGIRVVEIRTAHVTSNFIESHHNAPGRSHDVPKGSIFEPAKETARSILLQERFVGKGCTASQWAGEVVADLLGNAVPPVIYRGEEARGLRLMEYLPKFIVDGIVKQRSGFDLIEKIFGQKC